MPTITGRGQSRDPWSLHVAAQPQLLDRPVARGYTSRGTIIRPRTIHCPAHATTVLAEAVHDRRVLPRWIQRSVIRDASHNRPDSPALQQRWGWASREHWSHTVVSIAFHVHRRVMARERISLATLLRWAEVKSLYAQGGDPRRCIVSPRTLAELMLCSVETVKRYNRAARAAGLEYVIEPGRMLTCQEVKIARACRSTQRGLATVVALCTPKEIVDRAVAAVNTTVSRNTPSSGTVSSLGIFSSPAITSAIATDQLRRHGEADPPAPPSRPARTGPSSLQKPHTHPEGNQGAAKPAQRRRKLRHDPGIGLATELVTLVPWLRGCARGRIAPMLNKFARADYPWTATRILRAMDAVNLRLGYNSPTTSTTPWALLAWYIGQIDPVADAPTTGALVGSGQE